MGRVNVIKNHEIFSAQIVVCYLFQINNLNFHTTDISGSLIAYTHIKFYKKIEIWVWITARSKANINLIPGKIKVYDQT